MVGAFCVILQVFICLQSTFNKLIMHWTFEIVRLQVLNSNKLSKSKQVSVCDRDLLTFD